MRTWHSTLATMRLTYSVGMDFNWIYLPYFSMLAILISANIDKQPNAATNALLIVTLSSAVFGQLLVFSDRCVKLVRHANAIRLPDCRAQVVNAHLIPIVGLMIIPSALLIFMNGEWTDAVIVFCAGLFGLMLPLVAFSRPRLISINLPTLLFVVPMVMLSVVGIYWAISDTTHAALYLLPTIILQSGVWLWHWHGEFSGTLHRVSFRQADRSMSWFHDITYPRAALQHIHGSPSTVVRMFIGAPYAPIALWQRLMQGCLLLFTLLLLACSLYFSAGLTTWVAVKHVWQWLWSPLLYTLAVGYWIQYMDAAAKSFGRTGLQISELALLPCMGNSPQQLRAFLWGMFGRPIQLSLTLLVIVIVLRYQQTHELGSVLRLAIASVLAIVFCISQILQLIVNGRIPLGSNRHNKTAESRATQLRTVAWATPWCSGWLIFAFAQGTTSQYWQIYLFILHRPTWALSFAIIAPMVLILPPYFGIRALYKLSRRPHPFVEMSE